MAHGRHERPLRTTWAVCRRPSIGQRWRKVNEILRIMRISGGVRLEIGQFWKKSIDKDARDAQKPLEGG
ncbi:hypothetical protein [Muricoccus radiodurans]|uniref:hypothetical protein n=1 Tax=Muricoccus radiodurans TaxID=2231721 RepID=UPI003CF752B1